MPRCDARLKQTPNQGVEALQIYSGALPAAVTASQRQLIFPSGCSRRMLHVLRGCGVAPHAGFFEVRSPSQGNGVIRAAS